MKEDTTSPEKPSRRQFTKAAVIAAIAAPVAAFLASCTKQPRQAGEPTPAASPAPTQKKKDGDGSPITVGGGGRFGDPKATGMKISCVFKETDYPEPAGNPGKKPFRHPNWQIKTFKISTKDGIADHSDLLPQNGNCSVLIEFSGGKKEAISINGKDFGIDMDTTIYQKDAAGVVHTNPNASSYISNVILSAGIAGSRNFGPFEKSDNCSVCTDHVEASTMCPS